MAFSILDNNLYWIVNDQGSLLLVVSSLGGSFISETELTPPSGTTALSGLAWFPSTNSLWTNDFENDQYLEMNMDGSFTGNSFANPQSTGAAGAFGLGLSVAQDILLLNSSLTSRSAHLLQIAQAWSSESIEW